jgi:hypothetical protein
LQAAPGVPIYLLHSQAPVALEFVDVVVGIVMSVALTGGFDVKMDYSNWRLEDWNWSLLTRHLVDMEVERNCSHPQLPLVAVAYKALMEVVHLVAHLGVLLTLSDSSVCHFAVAELRTLVKGLRTTLALVRHY